MSKVLKLNIMNYAEKSRRAIETLETIQKYIDPNAFIAGGYLLEAVSNKKFGNDSDVDIFLKSPTFDFNPDEYGIPALSLVSGFKPSRPGVYWYNKIFIKIGTLNGCDIIQYKSNLTIDQVLDKFDINLCKIYSNQFNQYWQNVTILPEAQRGLEEKKLIVNYNLWEDEVTSKEQAKITLERSEKYKNRFPDFKVLELNKNYKPKKNKKMVET